MTTIITILLSFKFIFKFQSIQKERRKKYKIILQIFLIKLDAYLNVLN